MPDLVIGPLLRHAGATDATIWLETDAACEVEILGRSVTTFEAFGHHYALVVLDGLESGEHEYTVALDGEVRWPPAGWKFPPSVIRTVGSARTFRTAFGSCRVAAPHEPPYTLDPGRDRRGVGVDALHDLAVRLARDPGALRPELVVLLGDQVYADELSPRMLERIRATRPVDGEHGAEVAGFEEYTWLYQESWSEPAVRWLLSSVPSVMIFDDHDVHDDWNTSESWLAEMRREPWWQPRITGAFASYWLYQHLGNLSLTELRDDEIFAEARRRGDVTAALDRLAEDASRSSAGTRWSYRRDFGPVRLVVIDSRAGRVLEGGRRSMLDDAEWQWLDEQLTGDVEHLLVATSLPLFLLPAVHQAEAWNEAVCAGAWGGRAARVGERIRRALDLEHWAAFRSSFERMIEMLDAVARGDRGRPPATIVVLSGDVHHTYLAEVELDAGTRTRVYQAVCSPFRNPLSRPQQSAFRLATTSWFTALMRGLAASAGVPPPPVRWDVRRGPSFENAVAFLAVDGADVVLAVERPGRADAATVSLTAS